MNLFPAHRLLIEKKLKNDFSKLNHHVSVSKPLPLSLSARSLGRDNGYNEATISGRKMNRRSDLDILAIDDHELFLTGLKHLLGGIDNEIKYFGYGSVDEVEAL